MLEIYKRIREEESQQLEAYRKGTSEAPVMWTTGYAKAQAADSDTLEFIASEESEDRAGDVIEVAGWDLKAFKRNPVMLLAHNHQSTPIGKVPKVWVEGKQLLNVTVFDQNDPDARLVESKYRNGFMSAESVGFRPIEFEEMDSKGFFNAYRFKRQELLEISAVAVPMHPKALRKAFEHDAKAPFYCFFDGVWRSDVVTVTKDTAVATDIVVGPSTVNTAMPQEPDALTREDIIAIVREVVSDEMQKAAPIVPTEDQDAADLVRLYEAIHSARDGWTEEVNAD